MIDGGKFCPQGLDRNTRHHDSQCAQPGGIRTQHPAIHHRGKEDVDDCTGFRSGKLLFADANHLVRDTAYVHGSFEDMRVSAKAAIPVVVGKHNIGGCPRFPIILFSEQTPPAPVE